MPKVSIIMTTFNRDPLLRLGLESIKRQQYHDLEIIVVNDGLAGDAEQICSEYGAHYVFTDSNPEYWRVPGFALNIGAKTASGKIYLISCAEMWHQNNCIELLIEPIDQDDKAITYPKYGKDDRDDVFTQRVSEPWDTLEPVYNSIFNLKTTLPFLLGVSAERYHFIGGYDERLTGQSFDDDDFVERLQRSGCQYVETPARCVHLYHPRYCYEKRSLGRLAENRRIFVRNTVDKVVTVNKDIEWGRL